jgi:RNA 3'-terminal phosphate cyclase (ATP)
MLAPIEIDGAMGEGGGQIFRTSLSMAAVTGRRVRVGNIRAGRSSPGLLRQHLTGLNALHTVCGGAVSGAELGRTEVEVEFGLARHGEYTFSIGSAGSAFLVLQTVMWPLLLSNGPSRLVLEGGTHNSGAPCYEFFANTFAPALAQMGATMRLRLERHGFYPAGGGRVVVDLEPVLGWRRVSWLEAGEVTSRAAQALVTNQSSTDAVTLLRRVRQVQPWQDVDARPTPAPGSRGPGLALVLTLQRTPFAATVFEPIERRRAIDDAVSAALAETDALERTAAPVCEHLADQLLIPMALAGGGTFRATRLSQHTRTNAAVLRQLLDVPIALTEELGTAVVRVG